MTRKGALLILVAVSACQRGGDVDSMTVRTTTAPASRQLSSIRIVTLGDSLAYGAGDESGKGIAGRLRDELERRGVTTVETTNLGVNGAVTGDVLARLKQQRTRAAIQNADAIVLSVGANDLFRTPSAREQTLHSPLFVADRILNRLGEIVGEIRRINSDTRILILGGYNPVPRHPEAALINQYLGVWDEAVANRFKNDPRVAIVKMSDLVVPSKLSRLDSFHPGGNAYAEAAKRIVTLLMPA